MAWETLDAGLLGLCLDEGAQKFGLRGIWCFDTLRRRGILEVPCRVSLSNKGPNSVLLKFKIPLV